MDDSGKVFPVIRISRDNLRMTGMTAEQIALLTDEDLAKIAFHMGDLYFLSGAFANDLRFAAWNLLIGKVGSDEGVPKANTEPTVDWEVRFPVLSLKRSDLTEGGIDEDQIKRLTDENMRAIAAKLAECYRRTDFLGTAAFLTRLYLIELRWKLDDAQAQSEQRFIEDGMTERHDQLRWNRQEEDL